MNIYQFKDYKQILKFYIDLNSTLRGYKSRLSEACHISNSYLSQVLNSHVDLTLDQVFHLTLFWNMSDEEQEFTLTLFNENKSATSALKKHWEKKLFRLRKLNKDLARTIKKGTVSEPPSDPLGYYSSWLVPTIHIITSIKEYQTVEKIAEYLKFSAQVVGNIIQQLVKMNYLSYHQGRYQIREVNIHTLNEEASSIVNHKNWRMKTIQKLDCFNLEDIHYSGVHSLSLKDFQALKDELVEVIGRHRKVMMESSPEEVLVHFSTDFYQI